MFTVRATKKLLDRCGGPSSTETSTTRLGDWYATALFWRPQVALFVSETTRLPVFVPLAPAAQLVPRFVAAFATVAAQLDVEPELLNTEVAAMAEYRYAKTANRSVVGTINDFAFLTDHHRRNGGSDDLVTLSIRLAATPCGPLHGSYGFPDRALRVLLGPTT